MVLDVFTIINQALSQVNTWFDSLLNSTGFYPVVIGVVVLIIFFRLIIYPLIGSYWSPGVSDSVTRVTDSTTYRPFTTADGQTWYEASPSTTISHTRRR